VLNVAQVSLAVSPRLATIWIVGSVLLQAILHITEEQGRGEIWWRFGGGSDRNRALLGTKSNSMHDMQIAQGRINTGDYASR
jgi:hypothetical protein